MCCFMPQGELPEPLYVHAQRWGRAFAPQPMGTEMLFLPAQRLVLCGDVCTGAAHTCMRVLLRCRVLHHAVLGCAGTDGPGSV